MITIEHKLHGAVQYSTVLDGYTTEDWRAEHRYAVGFAKPNYPLPAIRHSVQTMRSRLGFRMFCVLYELPEQDAWLTLGWEALRYWH